MAKENKPIITVFRTKGRRYKKRYVVKDGFIRPAEKVSEEKTYDPFQVFSIYDLNNRSENNPYRIFLALTKIASNPTEESILNFVNNYGLLGISSTSEYREPVDDFKREAKLFTTFLQLLSALQKKDAERISKLLTENTDLLDEYADYPRLEIYYKGEPDKETLLDVALSSVNNLLDRISPEFSPALAFEEEKLKSYWAFKGLLPGLYMMALLAVDSKQLSYEECRCGKLFFKTDKNPNKKYCDIKCTWKFSKRDWREKEKTS